MNTLLLAVLLVAPIGAQEFHAENLAVKTMLDGFRAKRELYKDDPLRRGLYSAEMANIMADVRLVSDTSHFSGDGIAEMLERVSATCVTSACKTVNAQRQMAVLSQVPEAVWESLTAEDVEEILEHAVDYSGRSSMRIRGKWLNVTGPQHQVIESLCESNWARYDEAALDEIVSELDSDDDRLRAITLWMQAHSDEARY